MMKPAPRMEALINDHQSQDLDVLLIQESYITTYRRRPTRPEQELVATWEALSQSRRELEEIVWLTELLREVYRRMGSMMVYPFKEHGIKHGYEEAESFDFMFESVMKRLEVEESGEPPKRDDKSGDLTGNRVSGPAELSSGSGQRNLNDAFDHFIVKLDVPGYGTLVLHYTHSRSSSSKAIQLLFSHSWSGPFVEALRVVEPLSEPKDANDPSFHVVAPSIPGFGFSPTPTKSGTGPNVVARAYKTLMTEVLGAQHLNMFPVPPPTLFSAPATYIRRCFPAIAYSSFEHKARNWADVHDAFSDDDIITLVMIYWIQGATPALRFYQEAFGRGVHEAEKTFETYVSDPTGVSMYAKEQLHCPRDWANQATNIQFWREYEKGGHFSSLGGPDISVKNVREIFSSKVVLNSWARA
ncbi:alpha/beta-hydrolase [Penicillium robsamsonii]|uniref:alpha/beta-hydrolase n=1 Tax=Penicillium robsamsonii TaxID=1792511 RepID=UPI002546721E|nr:alpha/beta-hydrolase [Penicillium robsamsonii]KAJ5817268.1 alpha/beta-hydrolase [Penicillium robsamsonii]